LNLIVQLETLQISPTIKSPLLSSDSNLSLPLIRSLAAYAENEECTVIHS